ncbi:MAG: hypothetical protein ACOY4R_29175 [Pseudomonadota bacterium]
MDSTADRRGRKSEAAATHPKWDRKRGKPEDPAATRVVEDAHGRYSGSEQSEKRKKRTDGVPRRG